MEFKTQLSGFYLFKGIEATPMVSVKLVIRGRYFSMAFCLDKKSERLKI